jgi:hypothetical protein
LYGNGKRGGFRFLLRFHCGLNRRDLLPAHLRLTRLLFRIINSPKDQDHKCDSDYDHSFFIKFHLSTSFLFEVPAPARRHRIIPSAAERLAAHQTPYGKTEPFPKTVRHNGFRSIR